MLILCIKFEKIIPTLDAMSWKIFWRIFNANFYFLIFQKKIIEIKNIFKIYY